MWPRVALREIYCEVGIGRWGLHDVGMRRGDGEFERPLKATVAVLREVARGSRLAG